jgi:outer membrane protein OmpA-like peptidoglycan-associated protein
MQRIIQHGLLGAFVAAMASIALPHHDASACGFVRTGAIVRPAFAAVTAKRDRQARKVVSQQQRRPATSTRTEREVVAAGPEDSEARDPTAAGPAVTEVPEARPVVTTAPDEARAAAEEPAEDTSSAAPGRAKVKNVRAYFGSGSAELDSRGEGSLARVVAYLKANPEGTVVIEGHADSSGPADVNQRLSEERAERVRDYLMSASGASADRFEVIGYGETKPAFPGSNPKNRRVQFRLN